MPMTDQAAALRKLKQHFDDQVEQISPTPEAFIASLPRPCPFPAVALVLLPGSTGVGPHIWPWLPLPVFEHGNTGCWDLAGIVPISQLPPSIVRDDPDVSMIQIQRPRGPMWLLPQVHPSQLEWLPMPQRQRQLRRMNAQLLTLKDLWLTCTPDTVRQRLSLLTSVDLVCHVVCDHPDTILQAYETVKTLHLGGFFGPQVVIPLEAEPRGPASPVFTRLQAVSRQFLSLDLLFGGMIPSVTTQRDWRRTSTDAAVGHPESVLPEIIARIPPSTQDFLFSYAQSVLFPPPDEGVRPHD